MGRGGKGRREGRRRVSEGSRENGRVVCKSGMRRNFKKGVFKTGGRLQRSVGNFPEGTFSPVNSGVTEDLGQSGVLSVVTVMGQGA